MAQDISRQAKEHALEHPPPDTTLKDHLAIYPAPRWKKVFADLWSNKVRTLLVVMAIFIGVFAVGMIIGSQIVLTRELRRSYASVHPAHANISTGGSVSISEDFTMTFRAASEHGFDQDLVQVVEHMDVVTAAEGRRNYNARVNVDGRWKSIQFIAIEDFDDMSVNIVRPERGMWPPPDKTVLIERSGMSGLNTLNAEIGDTLLIERPDGKQRRMPIAGTAHDLTQWPTPFMGTIYGYVTLETMEWFGEERQFNEMLVRFRNGTESEEHNETAAEMVYDKMLDAGLDPSFPKVPEPEQPPMQFIITGLTSLMVLFGLFAILLSGFLVTNTISALLAQQIKQIGMMKAVGARPNQIMTIYIVLVLSFGLIALIPAIPLAKVGVGVFSGYIASFFNFDIADTSTPPTVTGLQVVMSMLVPVVAAMIPVYAGTHITIREALASDSMASSYGTGSLDRLMQRVRGLPRPLLLSLRNTFRRKGRVALTLITLTLGGAFFISVFSIKDSMQLTINNLMHSLYNYDIDVFLHETQRADRLESEAKRVPGVIAAESWHQSTVRRVYADDSESLDIQMNGVPPDIKTMNPIILEGRWLLPDDENALVISSGTRKQDPDLQVGSTITLKVNDRETEWQIVGLLKALGDSRMAYANYDHISRVAREAGESSYLRVITAQHDGAFQLNVAATLEDYFTRRGIDIGYTKTVYELSQGDKESIAVITSSLMFMALLVALVGGLGLAGTMSLNVIERTREIGIMRAIGASNQSILQIFMVEGVFIGLVSWLIGAMFSIPIGKVMSHSLGVSLMSSPFHYRFSLVGLAAWLVLSLTLAAVASFLPAWKATSVTVRDVLAYE